MKTLVVKTPAKINLTLEVLNKREDGFHNIKSIMQAISLYDFLTISVEESFENEIVLTGNCKEIPYDESNIVSKAWKLFVQETNLCNKKVKVYIDKNIPVSAGLAGGSTNAAGFLYGINKLLDTPLNKNELHSLCAQLGSDLNFCLEGGCALCTSRGEEIEKLPTVTQVVNLIKPKTLGISAKEAYAKFAQQNEKDKQVPNNTEKLAALIKEGKFDKSLIYNSFEKPLFKEYSALQAIKDAYPYALMSGSGSTFFGFDKFLPNRNFYVFNNLHFIENGVSLCK